MLNSADWYHYNRRLGKAKTHFNKAEDKYLKIIKEEVKDQEDFQRNVDAMIQLGHLYREGIPDRYDNYGDKIKGVKPNLKKAIECYRRLYNVYEIPQGMLWVGDIYHYDYEDLVNAEQIYMKLKDSISHDYTHSLHSQINDRLRQIREKRTPMIRFGMSDRPYQLHTTMREPMLMNQVRLPPVRRQVTQNVDPEVQRQPPIKVEDHKKVVNDPQNVHDSTLLQSIRNSISKLQSSTRMTMSTPTSLMQIRKYIQSNAESDKRNDAIRTLDRIETVTGLNNFELTESDTLSLVWNRINNEYPDDEYKKSLKGNVINELAESVEHGKVVCGIGRRSHILGVLDGSDKDVSLKPKWALTHEMMNKASLIRDRMEKSLSDVQRDAINTYDEEKITPQQKLIQDKFDQDLKNQIRHELARDYVDPGVMSNDTFNTELSKWIDEI